MEGTNVFFVQTAALNTIPKSNGSIMSEVACEGATPMTCNYDQPSFKAYLTRWLAVTTQLAPFLSTAIMPRLQASAEGAAIQCAGNGNNFCGRRWYQTEWDGTYGVGEQMSAMSIFQNLLIGTVSAPVTLMKGGTSVSDPDAGNGDDTDLIEDSVLTDPITMADRAGAWIMTVLALAIMLGISFWITF